MIYDESVGDKESYRWDGTMSSVADICKAFEGVAVSIREEGEVCAVFDYGRFIGELTKGEYLVKDWSTGKFSIASTL